MERWKTIRYWESSIILSTTSGMGRNTRVKSMRS
jgi:hypothetical protein